MIRSDVHIQKRITKAEKIKRKSEQNHQFYLQHRQCVKYHLHSKNNNLFIKSILSFVSSFDIFKRNTQFKI